MYYTYVLQSGKDSRLYTGFTTDLKKRLKEHLSGKVFSTRSRLPLELIYYEACTDEHDAKMREKTLKTTKGNQFLKVRLKRFFTGTGFGPLTGAP